MGKSLVGILAIVVCFMSFPASIFAQCEASEGHIERRSYRSVISQTTMHYSVYLPPCYDTSDTESYPTLYLMHGSAQYDDHWLQIGLDDVLNAEITAKNYPPLIVVLPYGEWIANENRFDRVSFGNVFIEELMPDVAENYRVSPKRDTRSIGGISRGGFWAYNLAFRYPALFGSVGGHSGFFDPYHAPPESNPLDLALNAPEIDSLRIWIDRGANDYAYPGMDQMDGNLAERGIAYTYMIYPEGEHDNRYWQAHVKDYLDWYVAPWLEQDGASLRPPTVPDLNTFVFAPPKQQPDPNVFVFTPPKAQNAPEIVAGMAAKQVFVPVVAFNSTQANIVSGDLWNLLAGMPDNNFLIDPETYNLLVEYGVNVNAGRFRTRQEVEHELWTNRNAYTLLPFDALTARYRVLHVDNQHPLLDITNYPLAFESETPNFDPNLLTTLTLSGVTAITRDSLAPIDRNGVEWAASGIAPFTNQVDFFHTSNEVSFTPQCPQATETPLGAFCSKEAHFPILELVGLDVVELTGNHNNDYGYNAYLRTLELYQEYGIETIGGGATVEEAQTPLILSHNGNTIAMVACNDSGPYYALASAERPGAADCTGAWLKTTLNELADTVDLITVTVQHVEFEEYLPRQEIEFDFRQIADWGADMVVGTHAHKPQSFEFYATSRGKNALLHFGLGNLFFDQDFWGNSRFWMDTLFIYEGELVTVDLFTGIIDDQARPRSMTAEEQKNWLEFMFLVNRGVR